MEILLAGSETCFLLPFPVERVWDRMERVLCKLSLCRRSTSYFSYTTSSQEINILEDGGRIAI